MNILFARNEPSLYEQQAPSAVWNRAVIASIGRRTPAAYTTSINPYQLSSFGSGQTSNTQ
ncbi:hypothetical protein HCH_00619 [Hahella chejuensis KCTC 2396]|uniref:Uncharacterized protein n=1 Tax=Hahella chejuensis (strain KCTC 2396) TaxID=349521 RepID=Q2SPA3_HAHCH|nr:hypothetical protein HCH_00619 [Hahella chejuensis KCTC 2396]